MLDVGRDPLDDLHIAKAVFAGFERFGIAPEAMIFAVEFVQDFLEQFVLEEEFGLIAALFLIQRSSPCFPDVLAPLPHHPSGSLRKYGLPQS